MYETLEVLIPTINKDVSDAESLLRFWNVQTDCIISNQCGRNGHYEFLFNDKRVTWVDVDSVGVSLNRNNLLTLLKSDLGLFIDDDCSLLESYEQKVIQEMNQFSAEGALFTGLNVLGSTINKRSKTIICKSFNKISHIGGPGICVSRQFIHKTGISFCEQLGTPNKVYLGEDSLFGYQMIKSSNRIINSHIIVFKILEDLDNSSYFRGFTEQYFFSKGAINRLIHPKFCFAWRLYYSTRLTLKTKQNFSFISKSMKKGEEYCVQNIL